MSYSQLSSGIGRAVALLRTPYIKNPWEHSAETPHDPRTIFMGQGLDRHYGVLGAQV